MRNKRAVAAVIGCVAIFVAGLTASIGTGRVASLVFGDITVRDSPDPATVHEPLTYKVAVDNTSSQSVESVTVYSTTPVEATYDDGASSGSCSPGGPNQVKCGIGTLAPGASKTVAVVVVPTTVGTLSEFSNALGSSCTECGADAIANPGGAQTHVHPHIAPTVPPPASTTTPPASTATTTATTTAPPTTAPPSTTTPTTTSPPSGGAGGSAVGNVLVTPPGGKPHPFQGQGTVPFGSVIDVSAPGASITLTLADGSFATFSQGKFLFHKVAGLAEAQLVGGNFGICKSALRTTAAAKPPPKVVRRLFAKAKGHFQTHGKYASAAVRGTIWQTTDRCDGTLIHVTQGIVNVLDIPKKHHVLVPAGKSYLAHKP